MYIVNLRHEQMRFEAKSMLQRCRWAPFTLITFFIWINIYINPSKIET